MTGSFQLQLDTQTQVEVQINGGAESSAGSNVTLELALDPDAIEVKVWGQIDPDSPLNTGLAVTEGEAVWLPATATLLVALEEGEGPRQLHVRVKDDVWNEAIATTSIFVGTAVPLPTPRPTPGAGALPTPRHVERRRIGSRSAVGVRGRGAARVSLDGRSGACSRSSGAIRASTSGITVVAAGAAGAVRARTSSAAIVEPEVEWSLVKALGDDAESAITLLL